MTLLKLSAFGAIMFGVLAEPLRAQSSMCRDPDALSSLLFEHLQRNVSSGGEVFVQNRQATSLPSVAPSDVQIIADTTICRRAAEAYDSLRVHLGASSQQRPVYVIKAGQYTYFVIDPEVKTGEHYDCMVFTDQWAYLKTLLL